MRLRPFAQSLALGSALVLAAVPALAHEAPMPQPGVAPAGVDMRPAWHGTPPLPAPPHQPPMPVSQPMQVPASPVMQGPDPQARAAWLDECRRRMTRRDDGVGGAVIGGLLGGVLGNRIAGKHHRTTGTIVGGVAGAVAGAVIDRAEDAGSTRSKDYCEAYLDDYYARYQAGYGWQGQGYAYGYAAAPMMVMVPVMMQQAQPVQRHCTETVVEEYIDVPVAARRAPPRRVIHHPAPVKRVRVVPDKRIPVN